MAAPPGGVARGRIATVVPERKRGGGGGEEGGRIDWGITGGQLVHAFAQPAHWCARERRCGLGDIERGLRGAEREPKDALDSSREARISAAIRSPWLSLPSPRSSP